MEIYPTGSHGPLHVSPAFPSVIPAQAGIQAKPHMVYAPEWIPACAGMTKEGQE